VAKSQGRIELERGLEDIRRRSFERAILASLDRMNGQIEDLRRSLERLREERRRF
jgi:hypothetical protein